MIAGITTVATCFRSSHALGAPESIDVVLQGSGDSSKRKSFTNFEIMPFSIGKVPSRVRSVLNADGPHRQAETLLAIRTAR